MTSTNIDFSFFGMALLIILTPLPFTMKQVVERSGGQILPPSNVTRCKNTQNWHVVHIFAKKLQKSLLIRRKSTIFAQNITD